MIRRLVLPLVCLAFAAVSLYGQTAEELFGAANEAYRQGDMPKALQGYEEVLHQGYVNGDLYYNLGNAYFRTGNVPRAMLNYERARRIMPADDDLRNNLQVASGRITDRIDPAPRLFVWDWWDGLRNSISIDAATWWSYACFLLLLGGLATLVFAPGYVLRAVGLWTSIAAFVICVVVGAILLSRRADLQRTDEAIVMAAVSTVKNSPDEKSSDAFVLHAGVKVQQIDHVGTWVQIRIADGKVGWIQADEMELI